MERVTVDNGSVIELPKYFELSDGKVCKLTIDRTWHHPAILYFVPEDFFMHHCLAAAFDAEEFEGMRELSKVEYRAKVYELAREIMSDENGQE